MGLKNLLLGVCIGVLVCIAVAMFMSGGMADPVGFVNKIIIHDPGNSTRVYYTGNETVINVVAPTPQPTTQPTPIIIFVTPTPQSTQPHTPPQIPTIPPSLQPTPTPTPTPQPTATPTPTPSYEERSAKENYYRVTFMENLRRTGNTSLEFTVTTNQGYTWWINLLAGEAADHYYGVDDINTPAFDGKPEFNGEWPSGPAPNADPDYWIDHPVLFVQDLQTLGLVKVVGG